jgi:opacity protein-like surface antigen
MRKALLTAALLGLGVAGTATAKDRQGDFNVQAKAGVGDFTGGLGDYTSAGPSWGVAVNLQPTNVLGLEISYDGSRNSVNDARETLSPTVMRHGGTALVKIAPPFIERIKPYAGFGLGASYVTVQGAETGAYQNDLMEEIPVAAGLEFNSGAVTAGVRATYRWLIDEGFADAAQPVGNPEGGLFDASFTLGARF